MNGFDLGVLLFVRHLIPGSRGMAGLAEAVESATLLKGTAFMAVAWWWWFQPGARARAVRTRIILMIPIGMTAVLAARSVALAVPFRARPINTPVLGLSGDHVSRLLNWSSFPSDHASLFFALSVSLYFISRRLGLWAVVYTVIVICLPRVWLGLHWTTDVLGGAAIGVAVGWLGNGVACLESIPRAALRLHERSAPTFYALAFVVSSEVGSLFEDVRVLGRFALRALRGL